MPIFGLGTWQLTDDTADRVATAIVMGYSLIDTSGDYGTQPGVGEGVAQSGVPREQIYLVSKIEETDDAYEASQKNVGELGVGHVDLMLIHRPPQTDVGVDLWHGLIRAKRDGLVKDIGVSNYSAGMIVALIEATGEVPAVNQIEWTPFGHSLDMLAFLKGQHIVAQAYSPLTRGKRLAHEVVNSIATQHGKTPAQVLLRWNLELGVVPIPKASRHEHLEENIDVFDFELSEDDMARLTALNERYSSLGELPYV